jgi:Ca-activated chloride channel family protein
MTRAAVTLLLPALLSAAPVSIATTPVAAQAQGTETMLILDASGSMWGLVDGRTKIAGARTAVGTILGQFKPGDRVGLMVYGHRSKGECRDIETVVPLSPFNPDRIRAAVAGVEPKGRTPIADSLRQAAAALKGGEARANVILVSDGIETCNADPCAVAAELKRADVGLVAHVIGFDVADPVAKRQLACIAGATGGVYLDAANADGLAAALTRAVAATRAPAAAPKPAPTVQAEPDPMAANNLRAIARLATGSDPVTDSGLAWALHAKSGAEAGAWLSTDYGARLARGQEPGDYVLRVTLGNVTRDLPVTVRRDGITSVDVVLDAGTVTSEGRIVGSGAKAEGVAWEVRDSAGQWIATQYDAVPRFVLPAGAYEMTLTKGSASAKKAFALVAGDSINLGLALDSSRLTVDAVFTAHEPVETGLVVEVREPRRDATTPGRWIATQYDTLSAFDLPSGSYEVIARAGLAEKSRIVEIGAGEPIKVTFDLQAGFAALTASGASKIEIAAARKSISGQRKLLDTAFGETFEKAMPAGDYVAIVTRGTNTSEVRFTVSAGERTEQSLD